jgi:hypothetical protein
MVSRTTAAGAASMSWERLEIEDTSDCEACTRRSHGVLSFLATTKADCLDNVVCQECGREFTLWVEEVSSDYENE